MALSRQRLTFWVRRRTALWASIKLFRCLMTDLIDHRLYDVAGILNQVDEGSRSDGLGLGGREIARRNRGER
jgi:hypothetical protein